MIDFNGTSTRLELIFASKFGNCIHCTFIFTFFVCICCFYSHLSLSFIFFFFFAYVIRIILKYLFGTGTLTGTTSPRQSGLENDVNEEVLHIPQVFRIRASPSVGFWWNTQDTPFLVGGAVLPFCIFSASLWESETQDSKKWNIFTTHRTLYKKDKRLYWFTVSYHKHKAPRVDMALNKETKP